MAPNSLKRTIRGGLYGVLISVFVVSCGGGDSSSNNGNGSSNGDVQTGDLYVFGDSLSDTGNLGRPATFGDDLPAPFFQNRISNGRVIVEYVAESLGQTLRASNYLDGDEEGTNYAIAGANANGSGADIDLSVQTASFVTKNRGRVDPADIFLIFIGGNDILDAVDDDATATSMLDQSAAEVSKAVRNLAALGARNFFVLTAPDIGKTPKVLEDDAMNGNGRAAFATTITRHYNDAVRSQLATVTNAGVSITVVDVFAIFNDIFARAAQLGFTNTTQGCYVTDQLRFSDTCNASIFDSYIFFDKIHPTGKTHQLIGAEVARQVGAALGG